MVKNINASNSLGWNHNIISTIDNENKVNNVTKIKTN